MNQNPSAEVVAATPKAASASAKAKKIARVGGAAVFTFAMFGTLALPAYAFNAPEEATAPVAAEVQTMKVTAGYDITEIVDVPLEVDSTVAEQERLEKERAEAAKAADERAKQTTDSAAPAAAAAAAVEVPAGVGAGGIVSAALAQLGVAQDCTDLVQNSIAAVGLTSRRDQGGYDHGVGDFSRYGQTTEYVHGVTELAPGDILVWPGAHVAVYVGGGQAVHGGWAGFTTAVAGITRYGNDYAALVVRMS